MKKRGPSYITETVTAEEFVISLQRKMSNFIIHVSTYTVKIACDVHSIIHNSPKVGTAQVSINC